MTYVKMPVWLRWKSRNDAIVLAGFKVLNHDISDEIGYRYRFVITHFIRLYLMLFRKHLILSEGTQLGQLIFSVSNQIR
jgi:hypothetical protein